MVDFNQSWLQGCLPASVASLPTGAGHITSNRLLSSRLAETTKPQLFDLVLSGMSPG